jgi:hypothetical protein
MRCLALAHVKGNVGWDKIRGTCLAGRREPAHHDRWESELWWAGARLVVNSRNNVRVADSMPVGWDQIAERAQAHHSRLESTSWWACACYAVWSHPTA